MAPKRKPLSAAVEKSLRAKADKSRFTYRQLAAVYRRGQGAYLSSKQIDFILEQIQNPSFIIASLEIMGGMSFLIILVLLLLYIISRMSAKTCFLLDKETLKIQEKILGFEYDQEEESKKDIIGIFIHELRHRYDVTINTRKMIYQLGNKLTEEEAIWLAKEIENWLN